MRTVLQLLLAAAASMRGCVSCSKNRRSASLPVAKHDFRHLAAADLPRWHREFRRPSGLRSSAITSGCAQHVVPGPIGIEHDGAQVAQARWPRRTFAAGDAADEAEDEHGVGGQRSAGRAMSEIQNRDGLDQLSPHTGLALTSTRDSRRLFARRPVRSDVDIDLQRHGQIRRRRPFLRRPAFPAARAPPAEIRAPVRREFAAAAWPADCSRARRRWTLIMACLMMSAAEP